MTDTIDRTVPGRQRPQREWWHRHLEPEERRRCMADLALVPVESWTFRFTVMLTLSVVVAVMGLSANSAAVVIGAMLLAPLMTPVVGLAASLAMALTNKIFLSVARVTLATSWCIGIAYLISLLTPNQLLSSEVISRTSPDVRDLVVALAAGLAGSYATVRSDSSAALPGVAVAVALVPPLAAVGVTLEAGRTDLAQGALLLYGTNLAAIVFAGVGVFLVTGFVPPRRLARTTPGILAGAAIATAVVVAVAIPLVRASLSAATTAQLQQQVDQAVATWLDGYDIAVNQVDINQPEHRVSVEVSGLTPPPEQAMLVQLLVPLLGIDARANVQWVKTEQATTTTTIAPSTTVVSDEELRLAKVTAIVTEWLSESTAGDASYDLEALYLDGDALRVDVLGTGESPPVDDLVTRLGQEGEQSLSVTMTWIPRSIVSPGTVATPVEIRRSALRGVVQNFASEQGLNVVSFDYNGDAIAIEFSGETAPKTTALVQRLLDIAGNQELPVDVFFTQRQRIETTTTTNSSSTSQGG